MFLGRFFSRFKECRGKFVGKTNVFRSLFFYVDYCLDYLFFGISPNDYFAYHFYKVRLWYINDYITCRRHFTLQYAFNDQDKKKLLRDKSLFNELFSDFLHRKYCDLNNIDEESFVQFFEEQKVIFVKEVSGYRGQSVWRYKIEDTNPRTLFKQLKEDTDKHYIAEEQLVEHDALASFHPSSVNTIRVVTIYDDKEDIVHFMFAKLRMGNNGACMDNTHAGGISGNIDIETGIIKTVGYGVFMGEEYVHHPLSKKQIVGFQMPNWNECKQFVEKAARVVPDIRYVGWDVVLLQNGEFALIEANDNPDHDGQQIHNRGMWHDYKPLLKKIKK